MRRSTSIRITRWAAMLAVLAIGMPLCADEEPSAAARKLVLVHYMPWYASKPKSGQWGWHWTMNHFDPDRPAAPELASHYTPLIGPYDSSDPDVLEYHLLLLRIAGIDGLIADWYGNDDFNDYQFIHNNTQSLFDMLERRGMKFAVCYEDRAIRAMAEKGRLSPTQAVEKSIGHLRFAEDHWFGRPAYIKWRDRPVLLVFGPDFLEAPQWQAAFGGLRAAPALFSLHDRKPPASGSFAWPPMWKSRAGILNATDLDAYLDAFEKKEQPTIAGVFPGFHDIYQEAGLHQSFGRLFERDGATFRETLERGLRAKSPLVQIITWNDFGEGTCIEPSREYGYRYLEVLQRARGDAPGDPLPFRVADLRLPLRIYELRKRAPGKTSPRKSLDELVDRLFAGDVAGARLQIDLLDRSGGKD